MTSLIRGSMCAALLGCALAGCANFDLGDPGATAALPEARVNPACVTLSSQIETLRKEGVAEKVEKAALKKYKMSAADLAKADQLNKANAEFQAKCSTISPPPGQGPAARSAGAQVAPSATSKTASNQ